ncbi:MAG: hypothetical protein ACXWGT_06785 [Usitatibacter sp.]
MNPFSRNERPVTATLRTARLLALSLLAVLPPVFAAEDPDVCLTPEQRAELAKRKGQVPFETAGLIIPVQMRYRDAKLAYEKAVAAVRDCEKIEPKDAGSCKIEQASADERSRELEALGEERKRQIVDAAVRSFARMKAIRAEYASCETAR